MRERFVRHVSPCRLGEESPYGWELARPILSGLLYLIYLAALWGGYVVLVRSGVI